MSIIRVSLGHGLRNHLHRLSFSYTAQLVSFSITCLPGSETSWVPQVDIFESANLLIVVVMCPGARRESLEVTLDGELLHVKGFREFPRGGLRIYQLEGEYGPFERVIKLPFQVSADGAEAKFEEGVLKIVLPKIHH